MSKVSVIRTSINNNKPVIQINYNDGSKVYNYEIEQSKVNTEALYRIIFLVQNGFELEFIRR